MAIICYQQSINASTRESGKLCAPNRPASNLLIPRNWAEAGASIEVAVAVLVFSSRSLHASIYLFAPVVTCVFNCYTIRVT